jgi:hypothetical protein
VRVTGARYRSGINEGLLQVEHDGRLAWRFVAPEVKGAQAVLTVDRECGLLLRPEHPAVGVVEEWTDVVTGVSAAAGRFRLDGDFARAAKFANRYPTGWLPE